MSDKKYIWLTQMLFGKNAPIYGTTKERIFRSRIEEKANSKGMSIRNATAEDTDTIIRTLKKSEPTALRKLRSLLQILPLANSHDEATLFCQNEWYRLGGTPEHLLRYVCSQIHAEKALWDLALYKEKWTKIGKNIRKFLIKIKFK